MIKINKVDMFNPLSANPTKWPNTFKQFVANLPTNCLSVFGHFVNLALKGLSWTIWKSQHRHWQQYLHRHYKSFFSAYEKIFWENRIFMSDGPKYPLIDGQLENWPFKTTLWHLLWRNDSINWRAFPFIPLFLSLYESSSSQTLLKVFDKCRKTACTSREGLASKAR